MCILEHLIPVIKRIPPEGVDLFMCWNLESDDREYAIVRFYRKGSKIPELYTPKGRNMEERLLYTLTHMDSWYTVAERSGFYICDDIGSVDGNCHWRPLGYDPMECAWIVINPDDEHGKKPDDGTPLGSNTCVRRGCEYEQDNRQRIRKKDLIGNRRRAEYK